MLRILVLLALLAAGLATAAAMFAGGSEAAPRAEVVPTGERPASAPGPAALAEAAVTIQRTFVSTSGVDTNPCTRAQPCRGFAAAIANTTAGGEVVALDSGGYGPFTVDKSITVAGAPGAHVAVSVFSGSGIHVDAGESDAVVLKNIYLTGLGGLTGIFFEAGGSLHVESVTASGFSLYGLHATAAGSDLFVRDSAFRDNGFIGLLVEGALQVEIAGSHADSNTSIGFDLAGARGSIVRSSSNRNLAGFGLELGTVATISDSTADGNGFHGVQVVHDGTRAMLSGLALTNNTSAGVLVALGSPLATIGGSTVTGNDVGLQGAVETFQDNLVRGNTIDTSGTITPVGKT